MSERYQVRGRVGRGGMSAIYRAYDTVMGRDVALKRLLPVEETNLNEAAGESLAREAAALARFSHSNVVTVFAFEEDAEGPFVVMELVEGEDLHSIMKSGALSWEDFKYVAEQCLEPLVAAGDLNLLHRDIKPGNIMLTVTASGRFLVKLLDFGLAKFSQQPSTQTLDQRGSFLGSIDYIAPEQLELRPLDQRTDLYSLGCVFYYMLVQESPFTGGNPAETSMNHIKHRCRPIGERRPDLPPLVADWIMRLVSRYPDDRPANAREALKQFQEALKGIPYTPVARLGGVGEDDDVPFAAVAGTPPSGPVSPPRPGGPVSPPPSGPVGPPTGHVATRVIKTASGPVPAGRKVTGPVTGAQLPKSQTSRQSGLPSATGSVRARPTGPARPATRSLAAPSSQGKGNFLKLWRSLSPAGKGGVAGAFAMILAISLFFVFRRGGDGGVSPTAAAGSGDANSTPVPASLPPLPLPAQISSIDGSPAPVPLPVTAGLFGWFSGAKAAYSRDYLKPAAPEGQVAAWVNLAAKEKERSLLRDGGDPKGEHLPVLGNYTSAEVSGLRGAHRGLATTNRTSLSMLKNPALLTQGGTFVMVARIEAGDDRLYRFQSPTWDNRYVQFSTGYDGKVSAVHKGIPDGTEARVSLPWKSGDLGIFVHRWNPVGKEQSFLCRSATNPAESRAQGVIEFAGEPLGLLTIGKRGFGDSYDSRTGNVIFEMIFYDRVLTEDEVKKTVEFLASRYFANAG